MMQERLGKSRVSGTLRAVSSHSGSQIHIPGMWHFRTVDSGSQCEVLGVLMGDRVGKTGMDSDSRLTSQYWEYSCSLGFPITSLRCIVRYVFNLICDAAVPESMNNHRPSHSFQNAFIHEYPKGIRCCVQCKGKPCQPVDLRPEFMELVV